MRGLLEKGAHVNSITRFSIVWLKELLRRKQWYHQPAPGTDPVSARMTEMLLKKGLKV